MEVQQLITYQFKEQTLQINIHDRLDLRVTRLEKHTKLMPLAD